MNPLPKNKIYDPFGVFYTKRKELGVRKFYIGINGKISKGEPILPGMIKLVTIDPTCQGSLWECQHSVKIVLNDGREKEKLLESYEITALIHSIASDSIINPAGIDHFELDPKIVLGNFFYCEDKPPLSESCIDGSHEEALRLFFGMGEGEH
ncbi:MAG: hypothetical protein K940chlam3_01125 [Chlamydiae bacterium]|nr:hypothetical protein [Chlamydiota bacterium]